MRTKYKQIKKEELTTRKNAKTASKLGHYLRGLKIVASLSSRLRVFSKSAKRRGSDTTIFKA